MLVGAGRLDIFWVGDERALWHRAWVNGTWEEPESLGGQLASGPAVTAWAVGEMEVFAVLDDGQLWNRYWDRTYWHQWEPLGGELAGQPAASSWGADRLDVLAPGRDGRIWHRWWDGAQWVPWEQLEGGTIVAAATARASGVSNRCPRGNRLDAQPPTGHAGVRREFAVELHEFGSQGPSHWTEYRAWRKRASPAERSYGAPLPAS